MSNNPDPKPRAAMSSAPESARHRQDDDPLSQKLDVIEIDKIRRQALAMFVKVTPEAQDWDQETLSHIRISTFHNWGRMTLPGQGKDDVYMFSEIGEGPNKPLSKDVKAKVGLFAQMPSFRHSSGNMVRGFSSSSPFAIFPVDRAMARSLSASKAVSLREFLVADYIEKTLTKAAKERFLSKRDSLKKSILKARAMKAGKSRGPMHGEGAAPVDLDDNKGPRV